MKREHLFRAHNAQAVIFDKDGTLIDFHFMWGGWAAHLAKQIQNVSGLYLYPALCEALGFDAQNKKALPHGLLASGTMEQLYRATVGVMRARGLSSPQAKRAVAESWRIPDSVTLARPLTNLRKLFQTLRGRGIKVGVLTSDDRAPTLATLEAFDLQDEVSALICGDDGLAPKPAPDSIWKMCADWGVPPARVMVFGDTEADMQAARAAGAGLAVGVLSGVSSFSDLVSCSDVILDSISSLNGYAKNKNIPNLTWKSIPSAVDANE